MRNALRNRDPVEAAFLLHPDGLRQQLEAEGLVNLAETLTLFRLRPKRAGRFGAAG